MFITPSFKKSLIVEQFKGITLMRFDMTIDVTLRDDSSFGKLTNSCN